MLDGVNLMPNQKEKGLTLIEVLASIVILGIMLITVGSFFINGTNYSDASDQKLSNVQIANNILNEYKNYHFRELKNCKGELINIDVKNLLNIVDEDSFDHIEATLTIKEHPKTEKILILTINVNNRASEISDSYELTGYVRNEGEDKAGEGGACTL
jgi:prepilin-type N-terminal cleavage/methylation domain-containing protein